MPPKPPPPPPKPPPPPPKPPMPPPPRPVPPRPPSVLGRLQKGDLLMLAILYLILSEDEDDKLLPFLAIGLYLLLK